MLIFQDKDISPLVAHCSAVRGPKEDDLNIWHDAGNASHGSGGGGLSDGGIAAVVLAAVLAVAVALLLWLVLVKRRQWQGAGGLGPGTPYASRSQLQDTLCQQQDDLQYQQLVRPFGCKK